MSRRRIIEGAKGSRTGWFSPDGRELRKAIEVVGCASMRDIKMHGAVAVPVRFFEDVCTALELQGHTVDTCLAMTG